MERDFMGLTSNKESAPTAKEEIKDSLMANSGMHWAFSNKVSTLPLSFKGMQDDRPRKMSIDPLNASAFQSISAIEAFDSAHKISPSINQKTFNLDRQGPHFTMPAYPVHPIDGHGVAAHRAEVRAFPVSNNPYSVPMSHPFFKAANSPMKQPLGGVPVATSYSMVPVMGSVAGSYTPRNVVKQMGGSAQLTIFYGGAVNVYEDVSPEKAQAIMFLAGQGSSVAPNVVNPITHVASPAPKPIACDGVYVNQSLSNAPCSGLSSPISVTSHPSTHSGSGSSSNEDFLATKVVGGLGAAAPASQSEPPKIVSTLGSASSTMVPAAVPQARKASLARFLEKRKERVMNMSPYNSRKSPEGGFGSDGTGSSAKSSTASNSLISVKEQAWPLGPQKHTADGANLLTKLEM